MTIDMYSAVMDMHVYPSMYPSVCVCVNVTRWSSVLSHCPYLLISYILRASAGRVSDCKVLQVKGLNKYTLSSTIEPTRRGRLMSCVCV